jgi:hypothetical protein
MSARLVPAPPAARGATALPVRDGRAPLGRIEPELVAFRLGRCFGPWRTSRTLGARTTQE